MRISHTTLLGAAMALSLPLALPAVAQTNYQNQNNNPSYQQQQNQMGQQQDQMGQQQTQWRSNGQWQGTYTFQGKIDSVDSDNNTVEVTTQNDNQLKLHYPTSTLQTLNEGDQVMVKLAYASGNAASSTMGGGMSGQSATGTMSGNAGMGAEAGGTNAQTSSGQMSSDTSSGSQGGSMGGNAAINRQSGGMSGMNGNWQGVNNVSGTVQNVNRDNGTVELDSQGKELTVAFAPSALNQLDEGEQITVNFAIRDTSSQGASGAY